MDCSYVGNLKGVGEVWQIIACDAASSGQKRREDVVLRHVGRLRPASLHDSQM